MLPGAPPPARGSTRADAGSSASVTKYEAQHRQASQVLRDRAALHPRRIDKQ